MPVATDSESSDRPGITRETVAALHAAEVRTARAKVWTRGTLLAAALGFWIVAGRARVGSLSFPLVGVTLFIAGAAALDWWRKRAVDPHAVAFDDEQFGRHQAEIEAEERHRARIEACRPWMTYSLIGCLAVIAFLQFASRGGLLGSVAAAGLVKDHVRRGEWWRLLTATYLHGSLWHLWANAAALRTLGRVFEAYASRTWLALVYLAAAIGGSLGSLVLLPNTSSIGASGAIMGIAGFLLVLARRRPNEVPPWLLRGTLLTLGLTAYIGFFGFAFIDNAAHAGGALAGILIGLATIQDEDSRSRSTWINVISVISAVALVAGAAMTAQQLMRSPRAAGAPVAIGSGVVTPITSVVLRAAIGPAHAATVQIENRREVALDAWMVSAFSSANSRDPIVNQIVDLCCGEGDAKSGPLAPREIRQMPAPPWTPQLPKTSALRLTVVVFSDRSFEGSQAMRDVIVTLRAQRADDLAYWIESLTRALAEPTSTVHRFLLARISARATEAQTARRTLDTSTVTAIAEQAAQSPDQFADRAGVAVTRMERERSALLSRMKR